MKAAYDVIFHIPSLKGGGAERVALELGRYFFQQGKAIAFFIYNADPSYDLPEGVDVIVARRRHPLCRAIEFRALLKKTNANVVISFLPYANLISLLANVWRAKRSRILVSEHRLYEKRPSEIKERVKLALLSRLYSLSDAVVAVSESVANDLRRRLCAKAAGKVVVIHNPCFIPDTLGPTVSRDESHWTVLAMGRLVPEKGFKVLINAFATVKRRIDNARLRIVGEGMERAELEALSIRLGLQDSVTFTGFIRDVGSEYQRADLFVCSSYTEGFGNVVVEALSFGLPVVSTTCGGPQEILDGGIYGTLVPIGDDVALAQAIFNVFQMPGDTQARIARASQFSLDMIGTRYLEAAGLAR